MPKIAVQIPIKLHSERIRGKNFIDINGKPLYYYLLNELMGLSGIDIFIYHDDELIPGVINKTFPNHPFKFIRRPEWLSEKWANGNHLLSTFVNNLYHKYDIYGQLFVTAYNLKLKTIDSAITSLISNKYNDSLIIGYKDPGFYWEGYKANYVTDGPRGLSRTQDLPALFRESTGMYLIRRSAILHTGTRVGAKPILYEIPRLEGLDLDTGEDLELARLIKR